MLGIGLFDTIFAPQFASISPMFRVDLPAYRGPLDLLLYLVRREELDLTTLALAKIVDSYIEFLDVLQEIDVNAAADFIETASLLVELKSQAVLPSSSDQESEAAAIEEPPEGLVRRLLEYRQIRDAASVLEEMSQRWQERYPRLADDLPPRGQKPGEQPIADLEIWDLVSAFGRLMRESKSPAPPQVIFDETPIHVHMQRIHLRLCHEQCVWFDDLFQPGMHKSTLIGIFLATLELTRHHGVRAEQEHGSGPIRLVKNTGFSDQLRLAEVDHYDSSDSMEKKTAESGTPK